MVPVVLLFAAFGGAFLRGSPGRLLFFRE